MITVETDETCLRTTLLVIYICRRRRWLLPLKENGDAVCWGNNGNGRTDVPGLGFAHVDEGPFKEISAGGVHTCGLLEERCCGVLGKE